jgi:hypothetical protein
MMFSEYVESNLPHVPWQESGLAVISFRWCELAQTRKTLAS